MQPYFFPYLGYWQLINAVDKYVVYDDVNYIKGGWIARNNILLNGREHLLTLPLIAPSPNKLIKDIPITRDSIARKKIIKNLNAAYSKAPYYNKIMPIIERLILNSVTIAECNYQSIIDIGNYLGIKTEIILSSQLEKNNELKGEEKVLHIVKLLNGDCYYNTIAGKHLYSQDDFKKVNIQLKFLKMIGTEYKQYENEFVSNLSIIDTLMFNDIAKIQTMLENYELID